MEKKNLIYERLDDQSPTLERVNPRDLAEALGAVESGTAVTTKSPFSMWAVRSRLLSEIVSTGGRPARRDASVRKIPVTDAEWSALDGIATLLKHDGVTATPGQVAGILLHHSLAEVLRRLDSVTPSADSNTPSKGMTNSDLEETLQSVLAAAAKAEVHLEELRPVALELLRRMRDEVGDDK